jgi:phage shock protein A
MPHFNRLTDIVTCNLTAILEDAADPAVVLNEVIGEIREGIAGAERCVTTASRNASRIESEINEQRQALDGWIGEARKQLESGQDDRARQSLFRKREVADLISALEEQHRAATATRDHLTTTLNALQARLVDAQRRLGDLHAVPRAAAQIEDADSPAIEAATDDLRRREIETELEELRKSMRGR